MRAAQVPPQLLLGDGEELLGEIVGARHDGERPTAGTSRHGMPEQAVAVAVQVSEDHRFRPVVAQPRPLGGYPLAQTVMVSLGGRLDRLQPRNGRGRASERGAPNGIRLYRCRGCLKCGV